MNWLLPLFVRIGVTHIVFPVALKKVVGKTNDKLPRSSQFLLQYIFAAGTVIMLAALFGLLSFEPSALLITVIGMVSALGTYCQWRAVNISLSLNSVFTFFDDIIGITLAYFLLHEGRLINVGTWVGLMVCLTAVGLIVWQGVKRTRGTEGWINPKIFLYIIGYSIIWGVSFFFQKVFAAAQMPILTFMAAWYAGSLITAIALYYALPRDPSDHLRAATWHQIRGVALLAIAIIMAMSVGLWSLRLPPLTVIQPIIMVSELILPALIGLYYFREGRTFTRTQKLDFCLALLGGLIIGYSYR